MFSSPSCPSSPSSPSSPASPLKPLKPLKNKTLKHCDCVGFGLLTARTGDFYCKIKTRQNKTTMKCVLKISCHFKSYHQIIKSKLLIKSKSNSNQIKPFVFFVLFCFVLFRFVLFCLMIMNAVKHYDCALVEGVLQL